jgi:hypothetical protein
MLLAGFHGESQTFPAYFADGADGLGRFDKFGSTRSLLRVEHSRRNVEASTSTQPDSRFLMKRRMLEEVLDGFILHFQESQFWPNRKPMAPERMTIIT